MNKYSSIYFNSLNKKAFLIPAARAAFSASKPILSTGFKNMFNAAKPAISSVAQKGFSIAKPVANKALGAVSNFSSGLTSGLGSMTKGYRGIFTSNQPIKNKAVSAFSETFSQPWNIAKNIVKERGGVKNVSARDVGTVMGVATPGLAINNGLDKAIDFIGGSEDNSAPQSENPSNNDELWEELNRRVIKYR